MADPICYLDMDGVIADFVGACLWNHERDDLTPEDITEWDFHKTVLGCKQKTICGHSGRLRGTISGRT